MDVQEFRVVVKKKRQKHVSSFSREKMLGIVSLSHITLCGLLLTLTRILAETENA